VQDSNGCYKDDVELYQNNGYWSLDGGKYQCTPGMGIISGAWSLSGDGKRITFTYQEQEGEYYSSIEHLSEERLVLSRFANDLDNTEFRSSYTKLR